MKAIVRETFEYEVPIEREIDAEFANDALILFGPDADDVRERAREHGVEMTSHDVTVLGVKGG